MTPVKYKILDEIAVVEISNPPVNAISAAVRIGLLDTIEKLSSNEKIKAIVITAPERTFLAGADIKEFEKKVNSESVIWQSVETKHWIGFLKKLVLEHSLETDSLVSKKIIENFDDEIKNFIQVCPKEMLNKLENPITFKSKIKEVS